MQTERAELHFRQGSSARCTTSSWRTWTTNGPCQRNRGPRGSTLQSDVKMSNTIYEEAKRVYERILTNQGVISLRRWTLISRHDASGP